jgi:hypothetical protein
MERARRVPSMRYLSVPLLFCYLTTLAPLQQGAPTVQSVEQTTAAQTPAQADPHANLVARSIAGWAAEAQRGMGGCVHSAIWGR